MHIKNNIFQKEIRSFENKSIMHLLSDTINSINIYTDGSFRFSSNEIVGYAFVIESDSEFFIKNGFAILGKNKKKLEIFAFIQIINILLMQLMEA